MSINSSISIGEGEAKFYARNKHLGNFSIKAKKGQLSRCMITFEIDTNGILEVSAVEEVTNDSNKIIFDRNSRALSKQEIKLLAEDAKAHEKDDEIEIERLKSFSAYKVAVFSVRYLLYNFYQCHQSVFFRYNLLTETDKSISEGRKKEIIKKCDEAEMWLEKNTKRPKEYYKSGMDMFFKDINKTLSNISG